MERMIGSVKRVCVGMASVLVFSSLAYGGYRAIRSPLFTVRVVEVVDQPESAPVDAARIEALANVPVGDVNLFALDLSVIEKRILQEPWIREVRLQKRFPQTLSIAAAYRKPVAVLQRDDGQMGYVDSDGRVFGKVNLMKAADLPVLSGEELSQDISRVREALELLSQWGDSSAGDQSEISSMSFDSQRGYRILATYPLGATGAARGRALVELGQEIDSELPTQLERLSRVFEYLNRNSIAARQIWADTGKKIVVKTAHGS
jgi:cell division protein FtsQ